MEFCPHCRRMVAVQRKTVDVKAENERHVKTICAACKQVILEAVRPLSEEPPEAAKPPKVDLGKPIKHTHPRPQPKKKT